MSPKNITLELTEQLFSNNNGIISFSEDIKEINLPLSIYNLEIEFSSFEARSSLKFVFENENDFTLYLNGSKFVSEENFNYDQYDSRWNELLVNPAEIKHKQLLNVIENTKKLEKSVFFLNSYTSRNLLPNKLTAIGIIKIHKFEDLKIFGEFFYKKMPYHVVPKANMAVGIASNNQREKNDDKLINLYRITLSDSEYGKFEFDITEILAKDDLSLKFFGSIFFEEKNGKIKEDLITGKISDNVIYVDADKFTLKTNINQEDFYVSNKNFNLEYFYKSNIDIFDAIFNSKNLISDVIK